MKALHILVALTLFLTAISASVALPITLDSVEFDDVILKTDQVNTLSVERGDTYEVDIRFVSQQKLNDVEVRAFISGFEFNDIETIEDHTTIFDTEANVTYVKRLNLKIPSDVDQDNYKLRIIISDRFSDEFIANFNLRVDVPRHSLNIEDVIFSPSSTIKAGSALLATVRVENSGEKDEDDVKVVVSIPALGISATDYIEEIENGKGDFEEEETEELFLRIPRCTKAGNYDVLVEVSYNSNRRIATEKKTMSVTADETCEETAAPKTSVMLGSQQQSVVPGQAAVFPVTVSNTGRTSKTFTLTVQNSDWATVSISPTSTLVVPAGQTQTVFVNIEPAESTPSGAHSLVATIASGDFQEDLTLTAQVNAPSQAPLKSVFEIVLIILVVILVIVGIVLLIGHLRAKDEPQTYY